MKIDDLYHKLNSIFVEYTTHRWKNGWQHEGNRLCKSLTIKNNIPWNNLFLLTKESKGFHLVGPQGFKIEVKYELHEQQIRIDIDAKQIVDLDIFYYIDNELDWLAQQDFIVDLCQNIYNANVMIRESVLDIPNNIYGDNNPKFTLKYLRDRKLNELGI